VRGEAIMPRASFAKLNQGREEAGEPVYANPRNAAADRSGARFAYHRVAAARRFSLFARRDRRNRVQVAVDFLQSIKALGLRVNPLTRVCNSVEAVLEYWNEITEQRHDLDYEADGVVAKVNSYALQSSSARSRARRAGRSRTNSKRSRRKQLSSESRSRSAGLDR